MSPLTDQIGRVLAGRYRLVAPIGTGASAHVYAADDSTLGRRVAVKVLHPALVGDQAFLCRFRAEAQAAASLNHPHVMRVFDWGEDDDGPFLVLEYLGGGSLRDLLDDGHLLTPAQAAIVGIQAAQGLSYAHRRGLVHRDIKPANILFDEEGSLRVADFGLARALAEAAWTEPIGVVLGTARYASPEQAEGRPVDDKADVYSLALVLFECITGWVPFSADTTVATLMARLGAHLPMVPELGPLGPILAQAAIPEPLARLDAAGLAADLEMGCRGLAPAAPLPLATRPVAGSFSDRDPTMLANVDAARLATRRQEQQSRTGEMFLTSGGQPAAGGGAPGAGAASAAAPTSVGGASGFAAGSTGLAGGAIGGALSWGMTAPSPPRGMGVTPPGSPAGGPPDGVGPGGRERGASAGVGGGAGGGAGVGAAGALPAGSRSRKPPRLLRSRRAAEAGGSPVSSGSRRARQSFSGSARTKRSGGWWAARLGVAALVVCGLLVAAGAGVMSYRHYVVYGHTVPSLTGMGFPAAQAKAAGDDLLIALTGEQYSSTVGPGMVIRQSIPVGTGERGGTAIGVVLSEGLAPVEVPSIGGLSYAAAVTKLKAAGLQPFEEPTQYNETVLRGWVISFSPSGREVKAGSPVDVVVSKGPAPRFISASIENDDWSQASAYLTAMRLVPDPTYQYSDTVQKGFVISTSPSNGVPIQRGATVEVYISRGPEWVTVPQITLDSVRRATAMLAARGLSVAGVYGFGSTVLDCNPGVGATVHVGSAIALYTF